MSENRQPQIVTTLDLTEFPITIKAPFGEVTLVGRAEFFHDVMNCDGFYVEGDPEGDRAMLFFVDDEVYEVV